MQSIIGKTVRGKIDRPSGSFHPRFPDMIYEVKSGKMYRDGITFYRSENGVWLTKFVDAKYLERLG